ncbi:MAG TPA: cytochrome c oxidase subunit 3 [Candidatus Angelobacter sp.]|nr:cytochrome c oxidase subunit 3 [Candidatus Angelobacter sp.]
MSPITDHIEVERKPKLGGGGPGKTPHRYGFGGGDDGGDHHRPDDFLSRRDRLRRYRIGVLIGMVSVAVLFIGLTSAYVARAGQRHWDLDTQTSVRDWQPLVLPYRQLIINSCILLLSSITLEMARRSLVKRMEFSTLGILPPRLQTELPWLTLTVGLGLAFLASQILLWNTLRQSGMYLVSNPSSSFFYLLTGLHAVHLAGGVVVLLCALLGSWLRLRHQSQQITVDVTAWYWHFMGMLWLYIFALLYFVK